MLKWTDSKNFSFMLEGGHGICAIFLTASATAEKSKATGLGTIFLDIETYENKEIKEELKQTSVITRKAWLWQCVGTAKKSLERAGQTLTNAD